MKIDIEGLNRVMVVKALYDNALPTEKTQEKTDAEILDTIKYFLNKDRKIVLINGKHINVDTGRWKLVSGVYDKFNGQFKAMEAIRDLKSRYTFIATSTGVSLEQCINDMSKFADDGFVAYTIFNGHPIYTDSIDVEDIYMRCTGKSYDEYYEAINKSIGAGREPKQALMNKEACDKMYKKKISTIVQEYFARAINSNAIPHDSIYLWRTEVYDLLQDPDVKTSKAELAYLIMYNYSKGNIKPINSYPYADNLREKDVQEVYTCIDKIYPGISLKMKEMK